MPSFQQLQEWQDEYYAGLRNEIKTVKERIIYGDESIKDFPFAIAYKEWIVPIHAAVSYILYNRPLEALIAQQESDAWHGSRVDRSRFRLSNSELFGYLRNISKYCLWSLLGKINCPSYCEEMLFDAIQNNDPKTYHEICRDEKLDLSQLSLAAGLLSFYCPIPNDLPPEEFNARYEKKLLVSGTSITVLDNYYSKLADRLSEEYSTLEDPHRKMAAYVVQELIDTILFYDSFELLEKEAINELLDNPEYDDLLAEAQLFYYSRYHELPSRMKVLIDLDSWEDEDGQETKPEVQPADQKPEDDGKPDDTEYVPHWPTDEELKGYDDIDEDSRFFTNTIFGSPGNVKASDVDKLLNILISLNIIKDELETKLTFLARYSGKSIPHLELKRIEWKMLDSTNRERALGYLIMKTAGAQYAKGADFFYYEINGKRALPDKREMGPGAHALNNPDRRDTTKIEFEHKFNAFLNEYLSSKKG